MSFPCQFLLERDSIIFYVQEKELSKESSTDISLKALFSKASTQYLLYFQNDRYKT